MSRFFFWPKLGCQMDFRTSQAVVIKIESESDDRSGAGGTR